MSLKKEWLYRVTLAAAPVIFKLVTRLLFFTCRIRVQGLAIPENLHRAGQPYIAAFWHYSIVGIIALGRGSRYACMVSASKDGEYIARIIERFGYLALRGSRSDGGVRALKQMVGLVAAGHDAAIVADGSKGPERVLQAGAILLASHTGAPVMPVLWAADRYFAFRSWDRTVLPKPFARVEFVYGEPLTVPAKLDSAGLEHYRLELETRLNDLYVEVWGRFGISRH